MEDNFYAQHLSKMCADFIRYKRATSERSKLQYLKSIRDVARDYLKGNAQGGTRKLIKLIHEDVWVFCDKDFIRINLKKALSIKEDK